MFLSLIVFFYMWRIRLVARTHGSHPCNRGSIPLCAIELLYKINYLLNCLNLQPMAESGYPRNIGEDSIIESVQEHDAMEAKKNIELFRELPSKDIQFFASHLARPDGFVKTLITGQIATSAELTEKLPADFTRTHRSHYLGLGPTDYDGVPENDYISFSVGLPLPEYTSLKPRPGYHESGAGLGFIVPAELITERDDIGIESRMGGPLSLGSYELSNFKKSGKYEPHLERAVSYLEEYPILKYIRNDLLIDVLNIARKSGELTAENQPEVQLQTSDEGEYPRMSLSDTLVLCPERSRALVRKIIEKKLQGARKFSSQIKSVFSIDIENLDAETVLSDKNIYWYPQKNITEAVTYLTTHKEEAERLFGQQ
jgi:hypothetical protein